jgi:hypothetical protein
MTTVTQKLVNENGIKQIAKFLADNHKQGERIAADASMLRAWAADAEFSLSEGNDAGIEIKSFDSLSGRTQTFTVSAEGLDSTEVEAGE